MQSGNSLSYLHTEIKNLCLVTNPDVQRHTQKYKWVTGSAVYTNTNKTLCKLGKGPGNGVIYNGASCSHTYTEIKIYSPVMRSVIMGSVVYTYTQQKYLCSVVMNQMFTQMYT